MASKIGDAAKGGDGHFLNGVDDRTVRAVRLPGLCDPHHVESELGDTPRGAGNQSSCSSSESVSEMGLFLVTRSMTSSTEKRGFVRRTSAKMKIKLGQSGAR